MKNYFAVRSDSVSADVVLLILRLVTGLAFILHGQGKIQAPFSWMPDSSFPGIFLALAAFAEFGGGIALVLGLLSRLSAFGIFCTMVVAAYLHGVVMGDPFVGKGGPSYELAVVYMVISLIIMVMGPGRYSIDRKLFGLNK